MKTAVRYYSRSGNTKVIAETLAKAAGVNAISVDSVNAGIQEEVDVLFVGGALYAYGIDDHLKKYLEGLNGSRIGKAVIFSSSWLSKHAIDLIKKALQEKGVTVVEESFYVRGKPGTEKLQEAESFARKFI